MHDAGVAGTVGGGVAALLAGAAIATNAVLGLVDGRDHYRALADRPPATVTVRPGGTPAPITSTTPSPSPAPTGSRAAGPGTTVLAAGAQQSLTGTSTSRSSGSPRKPGTGHTGHTGTPVPPHSSPPPTTPPRLPALIGVRVPLGELPTDTVHVGHLIQIGGTEK